MPATVTNLPAGTQLPAGANGISGAGQTLNEANFFQLLTAQLEHQDPLNPMSGDQFAAELAQFSTAAVCRAFRQMSARNRQWDW